jgi:hypothetical protein
MTPHYKWIASHKNAKGKVNRTTIYGTIAEITELKAKLKREARGVGVTFRKGPKVK